MAKVVLLSHGGNMILIASCLSSISTYFMGMLHLKGMVAQNGDSKIQFFLA
jgi:hypothetical protein